MVHISVAIGRFFEALLFAGLRVGGVVTGTILLIALGGAFVFALARWLIARGRRSR